MEEMMLTDNEIKNPDSPFTELFSLLTSSEDFKTKYTSNQLRAMYSHSENALDAILQGMQDFGRLMGLADCQKCLNTENYGFFISSLSNLGEALIAVKRNASYILRQRDVIDC